MSTPTNNNYAPPQSVVADISTTDGVFEKATRWSRLGAVIIDGLIFGIPMAPAYTAIFRSVAHGGPMNAGSAAAALMASGGLFYVGGLIDLVLLVIMAVLVYRNAQTFGKKLVGIKVARTNGERASFARIFWLRNVVNALIGFIPLIGMFYPLVDSLFIFGEPRRCVHDYIADTIVIRA